MATRAPLLAREVSIIKRMKQKLDLSVTKIAVATNRNRSTIYKALDPKWTQGKRGRGFALSKKDVDRLLRILRSMQQKAKARREITLAMIMRQAKCHASARSVREALKRRNIKFRKMREKPILTKEDRAARFDFARRYKSKSKNWWLANVHLHIDVKSFPAYINAQGRDVAAMRMIRGAYRKPGQGLDEAYVVVRKDLRFNPGARAVKVLGAVGRGRVRVWHVLPARWNGGVAASAYRGPILQGLRRAWPHKRVFHVLEDNDPAGFKSSKAESAKAAARIKPFCIPKRSPDLNVCDYALWAAINRKMRRQERTFPRSKKETRAAYIERLRRAAQGLRASFVDRAVGDMRRRCQLLYKARGGLIEE